VNKFVKLFIPDEEDEDEDIERRTCDVCERIFPNLTLLAEHQEKKRHYG